jgi:acetate kinase
LIKDDKLLERMVICHLGSGSSATAILNGQSIDTTMGYSPLEGLMMATRSGPMDIVAALTLREELGLSDVDFEDYLNKSSGLRGISGESSDIRELIEYESAGDYRAGLALRMFVYHIQQAIAALSASMNGIDGLVFTGTVGERSAIIRKRIINNLTYLGFSIDDGLNQKAYEPANFCRINPRTRNKLIYVIKTDEAAEIAKRAASLV